MNVYIIPLGEDDLGDRIFGDRSNIFWRRLQTAGRRTGVEFHTIDRFDPSDAEPEDVLLVLDHPEESFWWRLAYLFKYWKTRGGFFWKKRKLFYENQRFFKKKILLQLGPPVISNVFGRLPTLKQRYTSIYLPLDNYGPEFGYFYYTYDHYEGYDRDKLIKKYVDRPKEKFLVMIASNLMPHTFRDDLYGERMKAIKFLGQFDDFDLYGRGWDRVPKHPFGWFARSSIKHAWRGGTSQKWEVMSSYKFTFILEGGAHPGWITEKIFDCFVTGTIPIYMGAPNIEKYIPKEAFINFRNFSSYGELNTFLRGLSEKDIQTYRSAAMRFFKEGKDRPYTTDYFVDWLLKAFRK